jgi:hypothetical protein
MADALTPTHPFVDRFGAGLSEAEVRRFQAILERDCGVSVSMPEAWSRAIELLSLVEMLLNVGGVFAAESESSTAVRVSSLLTDSAS